MQTFTGVVQSGLKRGKALGYPTINIALPEGGDLSGIYASRVYLKHGESPYVAAAYADHKRHVLEAHILNFENDLYGTTVIIELHKKIRDEQKFDDDAALRAQIADDIAKVREYFKN